MATWAARLAMRSTASQPGTQDKGGKTPVLGSTLPGEGSPSNSAVSLLSTQALASAENRLHFPEAEPPLGKCPELAARHNRDLGRVLALRLPIDAWEYISFFLSYTELLRLAGTCRALWYPILHRDSIWEQQLSFWHQDIMDLRGGALLLTAFVFGGNCTGYELFKRQHRLYVLDVHREWHFRELESLEDVPTGLFTVPLHLGRENMDSDTAAPISLEASRVYSNSTTNTTLRMGLPAVGQPFVGAEDSMQTLRIWHPIRPGEDPPGNSFDSATSGNSLVRLKSDLAGEGWSSHYALDTPASLEEEEAMLSYVLACSEAEMSGISPPPPLFIRQSHKSSGSSTSRDNPQLSCSRLQHNTSLKGSHTGHPSLKPSEIMTLIDIINSGTTAQSLIPLVDTTKEEDELFLFAVVETLKGARRRRLHLGNHHRALANNGQTTRRRLRSQVLRANRSPAPSRSPLSEEATPFSSIVGEGAHTGSGSPPGTPLRALGAASSSPLPPLPSLPPPPINSMLRRFTGVLLEIRKGEAYRLCEVLLGNSQFLDDFILFHATTNPWLNGCRKDGLVSSAFGAGTRFFVAPELCRGGRIGLVVVDMVRMLIMVEDEKTARDDPAWMQGYARVDRSGNLVMPGLGYNAQHYERNEMRPL